METKITYIKNKEYTYVLSSNDYRNEYDNKEKDISIFELKEWEELLETSRIFELEVRILNYELDDNDKIDDELKTSAYFLYYSPYCHYKDGFSHLDYDTAKIEDIYERVFNFVENGEKITINHFREWISENYENITKHYEYIQKLLKNYN